MRIFRRNRIEDDPLLTTAGVAKDLGRNRTWIYRLRSEGRLPAPDVTTESEDPLWLRSTIRSWWVNEMGNLLPDDVGLPRYHRHFSPFGEPGLLHEALLTPSSPWSTNPRRTLHVRVFRGVDGVAQVVIVGLPADDNASWPAGPDRMDADSYHEIETALPDELAVAGEDTLWVHYRPDGLEPRDMCVLDFKTALWDVTGYKERRGERFRAITPADLHRVTGLALEVYSPTTYSVRVVETRLRSSGPVPVIIDRSHLWQLMCHLRALDEALSTEGDPHRLGDAGGYAAFVLADEIARIAEGYEFHRSIAGSGGRSDDGLSQHLLGAITPVPFSLSSRDHGLVRSHRRERPVLVHDAGAADGQEYTLDSEAVGRLDELDRMLDAWLGVSEPDVRGAMVSANQLLAGAVGRGDAAGRRRRRPPKALELDRRHPTDAYVEQMRHVASWDHWAFGSVACGALDRVPDAVRRRAYDLLNTSLTDARRDVSLFHDPKSDVLAVTFVEPGLAPGTHSLFPHGTANQSRVRIEWPMALPDRPDVARLASARLVAPPTTTGYRPVYLSFDGVLEPLPGAGDVAWGVSRTDTLTGAVADYLGAGEVDGFSSWLRPAVTARGPEALDFELRPAIEWLEERGA